MFSDGVSDVVTRQDLEDVTDKLEFRSDNRSGIPGTLHRISAIRNRSGDVVGITARVGRAISGHDAMFLDLLVAAMVDNLSILLLGKPGVGKTTTVRQMARYLADDLNKRVLIVDTSNDIGGDGDQSHPCIGSARRIQVPDIKYQQNIMIEAVKNHSPEILVIDEISTKEEGKVFLFITFTCSLSF